MDLWFVLKGVFNLSPVYSITTTQEV